MYNTKTASDTYIREKVMTASPVELIIMLYDEAIKQLKISEIAIEEKRYDKANTSLQKTQAIIDELVRSLDLSIQIGRDLLAIYDFVNRSIITINMKKDKDAIPPIIDILSGLRDAWAVAKQSEAAMYMNNQE